MQIGEVSKLTGLPISTLRYYDKNHLFPNIDRTTGGTRNFSKDDLNALRMIECLKNSGMKISEIKQFMIWCNEGDSTIDKRLKMFENQEKNIENQIKILENSLKLIKFKKWYYSKAKEDGTINIIKNTSIEKYPKEIKKLYEETH